MQNMSVINTAKQKVLVLKNPDRVRFILCRVAKCYTALQICYAILKVCSNFITMHFSGTVCDFLTNGGNLITNCYTLFFMKINHWIQNNGGLLFVPFSCWPKVGSACKTSSNMSSTTWKQIASLLILWGTAPKFYYRTEPSVVPCWILILPPNYQKMFNNNPTPKFWVTAFECETSVHTTSKLSLVIMTMLYFHNTGILYHPCIHKAPNRWDLEPCNPPPPPPTE